MPSIDLIFKGLNSSDTRASLKGKLLYKKNGKKGDILYTRKGLEDKKRARGKRPPRMGEHSRAPTMLEVGAGPTKRSIQDPGELAEQIRKPFEEKGRVVKAAIGQPRGDYMAKVRTLHEGNVGKFHKGPISVEDSKQKTTRGSKQAQLWRG